MSTPTRETGDRGDGLIFFLIAIMITLVFVAPMFTWVLAAPSAKSGVFNYAQKAALAGASQTKTVQRANGSTTQVIDVEKARLKAREFYNGARLTIRDRYGATNPINYTNPPTSWTAECSESSADGCIEFRVVVEETFMGGFMSKHLFHIPFTAEGRGVLSFNELTKFQS